jgi:hypothetical protein
VGYASEKMKARWKKAEEFRATTMTLTIPLVTMSSCHNMNNYSIQDAARSASPPLDPQFNIAVKWSDVLMLTWVKHIRLYRRNKLVCDDCSLNFDPR